MKQLKTIVALIAGLLLFCLLTQVNYPVSGSMQVTYQSEVDDMPGKR